MSSKSRSLFEWAKKRLLIPRSLTLPMQFFRLPVTNWLFALNKEPIYPQILNLITWSSIQQLRGVGCISAAWVCETCVRFATSRFIPARATHLRLCGVWPIFAFLGALLCFRESKQQKLNEHAGCAELVYTKAKSHSVKICQSIAQRSNLAQWMEQKGNNEVKPTQQFLWRLMKNFYKSCYFWTTGFFFIKILLPIKNTPNTLYFSPSMYIFARV